MNTSIIEFDVSFQVRKTDRRMVLKMDGQHVRWSELSRRIKEYSRGYELLCREENRRPGQIRWLSE